MVIKNKTFVRNGKEMIAGKVAGTELRGEGAVHRSVNGTLPRGLTAIELEIWKLEQKEKNKK
jgi:hypothetical protein|tara:strand:+ start:798 stop:983 length:186 start_codon:yes stop_codon:yes gene_type:complete